MRTLRVAGPRLVVTLTAATLTLAGCGGESDKPSAAPSYDSPIINEDVPKVDIKNLPDIEATRAQMLDLIERVRAEVSRLVPASAPWAWRREEMSGSCQNNGHQGVTLYFANLTSDHSFTDEEWALVLPAVERLAAEAGLTNGSAMQNSPGAHDVRITSDDGRELRFGSIEASLITGTIACRLPAGGSGAP
ncbi:LppA family lipoprotein [Mycolicibacterium bacteremicum]|uniref:LppA family lipoprotein n=1 Tax=Mycolicibacterium bacteremicum TaxID=564198 RepID=UPI0026EF18C0|nr:LppA family lipoprotein [Mycolicibacterium bacteremicum]